jgi:hypothetical protein
LASRLAYRSERSKKPICAIVLPPSRFATPSYRSAGFRAIFRGALTKIPGVCIDEKTEAVEYFHLLLDQHEIIYSEGAPTESLFTGLHALKSLSYDAREEIATIFPEIAKRDHAPKPARYIPDGKKQKRLIERHLKTNKYLLHEQDTSI